MSSIAAKLKKRNRLLLSKKRRRHISGVCETADDLARRFGIDPARTKIAALAHDMERETPPAEMVAIVKKYDLEAGAAEMERPVLLHGTVAAWRLTQEFGVSDAEVLEAVRYHTFGQTGLGPIALIVYASDYLEPRRSYLDDTTRGELTSHKTIEEIVCSVIDHSRKRYKTLDDRTASMYRDLAERR